MSLALALDQIRRPTWWYDSEGGQPRKPRAHNMAHLGVAARAKITKALAEKNRVTAGDLSERTGCSVQSIRHNVQVMIDQGLVVRHDLVRGVVFELTPEALAAAVRGEESL